jgi:predicted HicB family RNase H-like nuclease
VSSLPPADEAAADEDLSSRITLRLPESVKARIETAAARQNVSLNTWLVRAAARGVDRPTFGNRLTGFAQS